MSSIFPTFFLWILPLLSLAVFSLPHTYAVLVNVTVDDAHPDPLTGISIAYAPLNAWTLDSNCSACVATPDRNKTYMGTWHDTSHFPSSGTVPSATFQFNGSALYVYCIMAKSTSTLNGNSDMFFSLDGEPAGSYEHLAPDEYDYNVPVYSNSSIAPGIHTFVLQNGQAGGQASLALLDYIVYSSDDGTSDANSTSTMPSSSTSPLSSNSTPTAPSNSTSTAPSISPSAMPSISTSSHQRTIAIAVSCVLGILLLILIVSALILYRRRRQTGLPNGWITKYPIGSGWLKGTPKEEAQCSESPHALNPMEGRLAGGVIAMEASRGKRKTLGRRELEFAKSPTITAVSITDSLPSYLTRDD